MNREAKTHKMKNARTVKKRKKEYPREGSDEAADEKNKDPAAKQYESGRMINYGKKD